MCIEPQQEQWLHNSRYRQPGLVVGTKRCRHRTVHWDSEASEAIIGFFFIPMSMFVGVPQVLVPVLLMMLACCSPCSAVDRPDTVRRTTLFRTGRLLSAASIAGIAPAGSDNGTSSATGSSTTANNDSTKAGGSQVTAEAVTRSSTPVQLFSWEQFASADEDVVNLIVALKQHRLAERFRPFCGRAWQQRQQQQQQQEVTSTLGSALAANITTESDSPESCVALLGACRHLFKHAFAGLSGSFTRQQFIALLDCAGQHGIDYIEMDGKVAKQEASNYSHWWHNRAPPGTSLAQLLAMQREQQHKQHMDLPSTDLFTPTVQSFDQAWPVTSGSPPSVDHPQDDKPSASERQDSAAPVSDIAASPAPSEPPLLLTDHSSPSAGYGTAQQPLAQRNSGSSNGSDSISKDGDSQQLWGWILAEVGLAAQRQLATGLPTVATAVTADDRPSGVSSTPAEGAGGLTVGTAEGSGGRVTKNQDPGLPVDAAAIANPEISAFMPADENASGPQTGQPLPQQQVEVANKEPGVKTQRLVTALWNLDRLDQRKLPLDGNFSYGSATAAGTGKNVTIYMLDSGIKVDHQEFHPWGSSTTGTGRAQAGPDFVDDDGIGDDCDGHGTHVSSTAAGRTVGIAREATVVGVRVLDCDGAGTISNVVAALEWVVENAHKPAVASLSLGVPSGQWSKSLEDAVKNVVAQGIPVVVAAGNSAVDACGVAPARVPEAITVAASNLFSKFQGTSAADTENLYRWSNTGACIDVFAPGVDIYGACGGPSRCETVNSTAYTWASGTSMAAPHVTGMVAVYLEAHPNATPAEVHEALISSATTGLLKSNLMLDSTPNRMLYSRWGSTEGQPALPSVLATGGNQ